MRARKAAGRALRAAGILCAVLVLGVMAAGLWFRGRMRASLPILDGSVALRGLSAPVRVTRDSLGVPTVEGASRADVARATGWIHAQDRFFQMDCLRRRGAGELSELFGKVAISADREARMHGFRKVAAESLAREAPERRALLAAYAEGVNAGLAALHAKPWEYVVLRSDPRPWLPEDSVLLFFAMTLDLQDPTARFGRTLAAIRDQLGAASLAFFAPLSTPDDAALDGSLSAAAPIPPPSEVDLRRHETGGGGGPRLRGRPAHGPTARRRGPTASRCRDPWPGAAARSSPTTCTCTSTCRTSGTGCRCGGRATPRRASRCPGRP